MNSFKDLEKKTLEEYPLPLGIKSNVSNQLGGMRTFGSIIEVYLSRILEILTGMFGGDMHTESKTHMITLFTPTQKPDINGKDFLTILKETFHLNHTPEILWILPVEQGVEVSIKLTARDATTIKKKINNGKVEGQLFELR